MIVKSAPAFKQALTSLNMTEPKAEKLLPKAIFLVEPHKFHVSDETAQDNLYMDTEIQTDSSQAIEQHRGLAQAVVDCGVPVIRFPGNADTPDNVFPNNVFATSPGRFITGAMLHPQRQLEAKRSDIRDLFTNLLQYECYDLSLQPDVVAELTGAIIIDRTRGIGFCGLTQRANEAGCEAMHKAFNLNLTYEFELKPNEYHTNVVMTILADRVLIICPDAFVDSEAPAAIAAAYPGHVLEIDEAEKAAFAGNCIAVNDRDIMISTSAIEVLAQDKQQQLRDWGFRLHPVPFSELEKAGGSVRCAIGEIY